MWRLTGYEFPAVPVFAAATVELPIDAIVTTVFADEPRQCLRMFVLANTADPTVPRTFVPLSPGDEVPELLWVVGAAMFEGRAWHIVEVPSA